MALNDRYQKEDQMILRKLNEMGERDEDDVELSDWEWDFLNSMWDLLGEAEEEYEESEINDRLVFTQKQLNKIEEIWEEKFVDLWERKTNHEL